MTHYPDINQQNLAIQQELKTQLSHAQPLPESKLLKNPISIEDEIAKREVLKNKGLEQDIKLKKLTLITLFAFLSLETIAVFIFSYFQATELYNFKLEEWSFKLLLSATILQITVMLQVAVKHLFPTKK